jgi:hypothetical protein
LAAILRGMDGHEGHRRRGRGGDAKPIQLVHVMNSLVSLNED